MAINGIVQNTSGFLPDILLFNQAPILVWFDGTIIDIITTVFVLCYDRHYTVDPCKVTTIMIGEAG